MIPEHSIPFLYLNCTIDKSVAKANKDLGHDLRFMRTDSDQLVYLSLNYLVEGYIRNNLSVSTQFHLTSEHYTTSTWNLLKQVFHQLLF